MSGDLHSGYDGVCLPE